jgi:acetyltransferase
VTSRGRSGEMAIERLTAEQAAAHERHLVAILVDSVDGGASVGFLPPLPAAAAAGYWRSVREAVHAETRVLLIARDEAGAVVGTGQLALEPRANGLHRAEVQKLMVLREVRRRGIGRAVMLALEDVARRSGRTTLVLDTREGDSSERLYRSLGWTLACVIPQYAQSADGTLHASAFYFKLLAPAGAEVARRP